MKAQYLLIVTVGLLFIHINNIQAQAFKLKNYKITVQGTSTLHEWESVVEKVETKGSYSIINNALSDIKDVVVRIPVVSIKSTKGRMMDSKTYEAFNYEKHPDIVFTLQTRKISAESSTVDMKGFLTMAGVTKPIDLKATYKISENGELKFHSSKKLIMTDFKMEPPTAMMGTIKVGDEITVTFELTIATNNEIL